MFIVIAGLGIVSLACFDPSDRYSLEVVLNKPNITYNLSILASIPGVIVDNVEKTYIWRSHVAPKDVIVVLTLQPISFKADAKEYISVRIEGKALPVKKTIRTYTIQAEASSKLDYKEIVGALEKSNWSINVEVGNEYVKAIVQKDTNGIELTGNMMIAYKDNKTIIYFSIRTTGNISDEIVLDELRETLNDTINTTRIDFKTNTLVEEYVEPSPNITEELLKKALEYELKWLTRIEVVKGITSNDIDMIIKTIREGMAGWNSRLIYFKGEWKPYYEIVKEIPGGALIKATAKCMWDYPVEELPLTPPPENTSMNTIVNEEKTSSTYTPIIVQENTTIVSNTVSGLHENVTSEPAIAKVANENRRDTWVLGDSIVLAIILALTIVSSYMVIRKK